MAEKRDMLDDLIDIQQDWEKVSNPFGDIAGQLVDPSKAHVFNPADYKGRPRANTVYCSRVAAGRPDVCGRCLEVCPVDAIEIGEKTLKINDNCPVNKQVFAVDDQAYLSFDKECGHLL